MSIAQLNRATGCGPVGRGFESLWAHHLLPNNFRLLIEGIFYMTLLSCKYINLKLNFSKIILALLLSISSIQTLKAKGAFQIYGDIFQFLPLMVSIYPMAIQDWKGLGQLAIGTGSTLAITLASKYTFSAIATRHPDWAAISKRPDTGSHNGFPSGHTASAFSAAGFMQRRYGWQWGVPTTIIASLVGISRITSKRHTITQVIAGAILGYGLGYVVSSRFQKPNTNINIDIDNEVLDNGMENKSISLNIYHRF